MSNLLANSDFLTPPITTNTLKNYSQFTNQEKIGFWWRINSDNYFSILNGTTSYGYANALLKPASATQYASFQAYTSIDQTVYINKTGDYIIQFYYASRPGYNMNPLKIYINNDLIYTVSTVNNSWTKIFIIYNVGFVGNYIFKMVTSDVSSDTNIAIANLTFIKSRNIITDNRKM